MTEFEVAGHTFRSDGLVPKKAFHVGRRLMPVMGSLKGAVPTLIKALQARDPSEDEDDAALDRAATILAPIADALAKMPEDDANYILDTCLAAVQLKVEGGRGWAPVQAGGQLMFDWITMPIMLQLVWHVIQQNLTSFFPTGTPA